MTDPARDIGRLARTVAHLSPAQVAHRIRLQGLRRVVAQAPDRAADRWQLPVPATPGLPEEFRAVDADLLAGRWDPADLAAGTFALLNDPHDLGDPVDWNPVDVSQLWSFHLHYWEWAWSLAAARDRAHARETFRRLWSSWRRANPFGRWNAWAAYPVSLRAWVLVNVHRPLAEGGADADLLAQDIARHAGYLEHNLELDVGGNHIIKNIKALVGCGIFLQEPRLVGRAERLLQRELSRQVLPDGGHYELSPSYHCQVLTDLLDISRLLHATDHHPLPDLDDAIERMRTWLGEMVLPDGTLPLFNDCEPVDPALLAHLDPVPAPDRPLSVLADSGYVVVRRAPFHLVADVGQPGPASPPGHIHADCLSFALHVAGTPVVVDTGTSEYGSGPRRAYERSTAAHNTVEVDGIDQTEVFGAFRAGRRARATLERAEVRTDGTIAVTACHDGYRHLPGRPIHRRTWLVSAQEVVLEDTVDGGGRHRVVARLHLPGAPGAPGPHTVPIRVDQQVTSPAGAGQPTEPSRREPCDLAGGFGVLLPGTEISLDVTTKLPVDVRTRIGPEAQQRG